MVGNNDIDECRGAHSSEAGNVGEASASQASVGKPKKKKDKLSNVLLIVGIILLVCALGGFGYLGWQYWQGDNIYNDLDKYGMSDDVADALANGDDAELDVDWAALRAINPDIVAWIKIPGTNVDYPVVQGTDNDYYLTETFDGTGSKYGCIFLDYESNKDFTDYNSIIYGHNMLNGSMFHDIAEFSDQEYFKQHQIILIATPEGGTKRVKAIGCFVAGGNEMLRQTQFSDMTDFRAYVTEGLGRCEFTETVDVDSITHLYTLSTCSYQFNNARTIVFGVEIDKAGNIVNTMPSDAASAAASGTTTDNTAQGADAAGTVAP